MRHADFSIAILLVNIQFEDDLIKKCALILMTNIGIESVLEVRVFVACQHQKCAEILVTYKKREHSNFIM